MCLFISKTEFHVNCIYRCNRLICPVKMSLNVSISLIFSFSPPLPEVWLNKMEFDCRETVLPWRINALISMPTGTLYDCNTSTQCVLSSGFSARKYQTQLFTDTSKRHSSNSWLWKAKKKQQHTKLEHSLFDIDKNNNNNNECDDENELL